MRVIIVSCMFLLMRVNLMACSCNSEASFTEVTSKVQTITVVKVVRYLSFNQIYNEQTPMSMEVEVVEMLKGTEKRRRFIIWGDNGILCRPYLSAFKENNYYVIALNTGNPGSGHTEESVSDYSISVCGTTWLNYDMSKQEANGRIIDKTTSMKINKLRLYCTEAGDIINHEPL